MQKIPTIKFVASLGLSLRFLAILLLLGTAHAETADTAMVAIAYPGTSQETISRASLRAIFGMLLHKWPGDTPARVFVRRDEAADHAAFSKSVLQVFPHQLRMAWDRQVFSGQGQYPELVDSSEEMLSRVASTPGAIGYVKASEVSPNVRLLKIR